MSPEVLLLLLRMGVAGALYAFLLLVVSSLRQDVKSAQSRSKHAPSAHLTMAEGEGRIPLAISNIVGRAWQSSVRIDDETISSTHARISYQEGRWWLEDLGSRNGTMLNDIEVRESVVIAAGDTLRFGRVAARFGINPSGEEAS